MHYRWSVSYLALACAITFGYHHEDFVSPRAIHGIFGPVTQRNLNGTNPQNSSTSNSPSKSNSTPVNLTTTNVNNTDIKNKTTAAQSGVKSKETDQVTWNFSRTPIFPHSRKWTRTSCDLIEPFTWPENIWETSGARHGWAELMNAWNSKDKPTNSSAATLSEFVYWAFNQAPQDCNVANDGTCNTKFGRSMCVDSDTDTSKLPTAAIVIINSIVTLKQTYSDQDKAFTNAKATLTDQMPDLTNVFAPVKSTSPETHTALMILDIFSSVLDVVSAGALSGAFNALHTVAGVSEATTNTVKKTVGNGIGITKKVLDNLPRPKTETDESSAISNALGYYIGTLQTAQAYSLSNLTDPTSIILQQNTTALLNSGLLAHAPLQTQNSTDMLTASTEKMMYGFLIQSAWQESKSNPRPFILRVDKNVQPQCNSSSGFTKESNLKGVMSDDTAAHTVWCDPNGNSFYLLNGLPNYCDKEAGDSCHYQFFKTLDGGDDKEGHLDGQSWGGITLDDIIISSWTGFLQNNKQNGYVMPRDSDQAATRDFVIEPTLPMMGNVTTPGFFNFTICLSVDEALTNIRKGDDYKGPVCGTVPEEPSTVPGSINAPGAYTPGNCALHLTQYQKNEKNENLLNSYQMEIRIFDNANLEVGTATKQNAADPLMVVDTSLPYDLIAAAGNVDNDPVSFWYADQYWQSSASQCKFGKYSGGKREGDCGFSCPLPPSTPSPSATIAHPLPTSAIDASGGQTTYINTYIKTTSQAQASTPTTSTATPSPTYAQGNCGVHVEQYQKNEGTQNPSKTDYEIEVTLFDAKKNPLNTSGKVDAPANVPVNVEGLISSFTVTAGEVDKDPLAFNYNGQNWKSEKPACSVGKFDSGHRQMDCGFTC